MNKGLTFYRNLFLLLLLAIAVGVHYFANRRAPLPDGPLISEEPEQAPVDNMSSWTYKGFTITPRASYNIRARILATEHYSIDPFAAISSWDWVLGWRLMSNSSIVNRLSITQTNRSYYYLDGPMPIPEAQVIQNSANTHIIASTPYLEDIIKSVQMDDIIRARGYLVDVSGPGHLEWVTSTTRIDKGQDASEILWVNYLAVEPQ